MAIADLMGQGERYGVSKWASLQAAEKAIKAAIAFKGKTADQTHDLTKLCKQLSDLDIVLDAERLIADIQCWPRIRYGDEPCTREQALAAHHASLELVNRLREAGAFELGHR